MDLDILTRTIIGEYGNGTYEEKFAVGCVVRNRLKIRRFGGTYTRVCLAPKQFSCWNGVGREQLMAIKTNSKTYQSALAVAKDVMAGKPDITFNADHYLNILETIKGRGNGTLPNWVDPKKHTVKVGLHDFYNLESEWTKTARAEYAVAIFRAYQANLITEAKARAELLDLFKNNVK